MEKINWCAGKAISMTAGILILVLSLSFNVNAAGPVIIDHTCTDVWQIPETAIEQAKTDLHIAYAHTSHGSQLISGMGSNSGVSFDQFMSNNGATPGLYLWNNGGSGGALDLHDGFVSGDLGNPDRTTWAQRTRDYLDNPANADVNVIIWSWCGQADTSIANIDIYLNLMEELISDYPDVQFVFMTGHLTGSGPTGQLNLANEHIREHCRTNDRILYDFADIESYDPDGIVNYMELSATDTCDYDSDNDGTRDKNWALDWQDSHVEGADWWPSGAAHSQHLNGNRKGYAAWWLWATLAGWNNQSCGQAPSALTSALNTEQAEVTLNWSDNSVEINEASFIIQRRENNNSWDNNYDQVAADVTQYVDTNIETGTYSYRVVAYMDGDEPCRSAASNITTVQNSTIHPQDPSDLSSQLTGTGIALAWSDNSDNEENFIVERRMDSGVFTELVELPANTTAYEDGSLTPLHMYTYRIKAVNTSGESGYSNETGEYVPQQAHTLLLKQSVDGYLGCSDTYLDAGTADTNYGNTLYKSIGGTPAKSMAIKFELPEQLIGKIIHEARLIMFCWTVSDYEDGNDFELYEINEPWDENSATWYLRQPSIEWTTAGGSYGTVPVATVPIQSSSFYPEFDISGLVQQWSDQTSINNGLMIVNDSPITTGIKGSEYSEYGRPVLEVRYSLPSECVFDQDSDSDVDGVDVAMFATSFTSSCMASFANQFGY